MTKARDLKYSLENVLKETLEARKSKNFSYSLRAMARDLNISPSTLSKIMNGKYSTSEKMLSEIVEKLGLEPAEQERIVFFERCRKLIEFLKLQAGPIDSRDQLDQNSCRYQKSISLDKNIFPDVLFYLKTMSEGFFTAVESLSVSKDSRLLLDNTFDIREGVSS